MRALLGLAGFGQEPRSSYRTAIILAAILAFSSPVWATFSSCPSSTTSLSTVNTTFTPPGGCDTVDNQYSNFVVGPPATGTINGITMPTNSISNCGATTCPPDASEIFLSTSTITPGSNLNFSSPG